MAANWGDEAPFTRAAFLAYRNFDGQGGQFGDTSIGAQTSDVANTSVYASIDAANPDRMVIIALNKSTTAVEASTKIEHSTTYKTANVFTITAEGGSTPKPAAAVTFGDGNTLVYSMPARSVSVLVPKP